MGRRHRRLTWRRALWLGLGLAVLVAGYVAVTFVQVLRAAGQDQRDTVDAIVVLGAAQYDGRPSQVLAARLDHALELYDSGVAPLLVTTGSNRAGDRFTEAYASYEYLLRAGVPDQNIIVVTDGSSTWEELAAAHRQLHLREAASAVLVSDPYHSLRLIQIGAEVGLDVSVSSTGADSSLRQLGRETVAVSLGRLFGYRRVDNWLGNRT